jgi:hypothetical protein
MRSFLPGKSTSPRAGWLLQRQLESLHKYKHQQFSSMLLQAVPPWQQQPKLQRPADYLELTPAPDTMLPTPLHLLG